MEIHQTENWNLKFDLQLRLMNPFVPNDHYSTP